MANASTLGNMSPELMKVVERAQREPEGRFHALAHLIDVAALRRAYRRIRKDGALGCRRSRIEWSQDAVREVLESIYEQDFLNCSYGFRPKRSAHDAIRALDQVVHQGEVNWILEADIMSYFDSLDRNESANGWDASV